MIEEGEFNYYYNLRDILSPTLTIEEVRRSIENYFNQGGKSGVFKFCGNNKLDEYRTQHSFSIYLLGIYLMKIIVDNVSLKDKIISQFTSISNVNDQRISFYWFLTTLYHDVGYYFENNPKYIDYSLNRIRKMNWTGLKLYQDSYKVDLRTKLLRWNSFSKYINRNFDLKRFTLESINKGKVIYNYETMIDNDKTLVEKYYNYCKDRFGKINHGITGGEMLFSYLEESFLKAYEKKFVEAIFDAKEIPKIEYFTDDNLIWQIELFDVYRLISDVIITHNVWGVPKEEDSMYYKEYGLTDLKYFQKKISLKNPLLFVLCLVDAIDPYKFFSDRIKPLSISEVFSEIDIIIDKGGFIISGPLNYIEIIRDSKLQNWLNVEVEPDNPNKRIRIEVIE